MVAVYLKVISLIFLFPLAIESTTYCMISGGQTRFCADGSTDGNKATFRITTSQGYAGIGTNTARQMSGSDAVVVWQYNNQVVASDRHQVGHVNSYPDSQNDWTVDTANSIVYPNGTYVAVVSRSLNTGDSQDQAFTPGQSQIWLLVYSATGPQSSSVSADIVQHDDYDIQTFDFFQSNSTLNSNPADEEMYADLVKAHGVFMFFAWSVIVPIAIFIAKFEKNRLKEAWFTYHRGLMWLMVLLSVLGFFLVFAGIANSHGTHFNGTHQILGFVLVLVAIFMQIPLGMYINKAYNPSRSKVPWHDQAHWWLGRSLFIIALINIPLGLWLYTTSTGLKIVWFIYTGVIVAAFVIGQYWHRNDQNHEQYMMNTMNSESQKSELQNIETN